MGEEVSTFLWGYGFEKPRDGGLDLIETPGVCLSQECLELGERLLDRVQVGTVRRQIEQLGPGRADRSPYGRVLMAAEIVHHHDIAWPQSWNQELHHPGEETLGVDGGPSRMHGAVIPSHRNPATKVSVLRWPCGTWATRRWPLAQRPCRRVSATGATSLSRDLQPVTADPALLSL